MFWSRFCAPGMESEVRSLGSRGGVEAAGGVGSRGPPAALAGGEQHWEGSIPENELRAAWEQLWLRVIVRLLVK